MRVCRSMANTTAIARAIAQYMAGWVDAPNLFIRNASSVAYKERGVYGQVTATLPKADIPA